MMFLNYFATFMVTLFTCMDVKTQVENVEQEIDKTVKRRRTNSYSSEEQVELLTLRKLKHSHASISTALNREKVV